MMIIPKSEVTMAQEQIHTAPRIPHHTPSYLPIEDYAVIGDLHTVALVGKNGSIDWCCIPRFDSPSVFGAILDADRGGFFRISPPDTPDMGRKQLYLPETNILITRFLTVDGVGEITDFMPIKQENSSHHQHHIIRMVKVVRGTLSFEMTCRPAFNYARDSHIIHLSKDGAIFNSETLCLGLSSSVPVEEDGKGGVRATFTLHTHQSAYFMLESAKDSDMAPPHISPAKIHDAFEENVRYWRSWLSNCSPMPRLERLSPPRRPACRRLSAALATGTIAIPGCATLRLPSTACSRWASQMKRAPSWAFSTLVAMS